MPEREVDFYLDKLHNLVIVNTILSNKPSGTGDPTVVLTQ